MPKRLKDPASTLTHFAGFLLAVAGLVLLVLWADTPTRTVGAALYGGSLVALFGASSVFHALDLGERGNRWLQRVDHAAIYLLIAGSYVLPLLHLLDGGWRVFWLSVLGGMAAAGVVFKLVWIDCPTWLSTATYLVMGWVILIPGPWMLGQLSGGMLGWLVAGGLAYSVGALVYATQWPDPWPRKFGHHEVWHLFVLAGAALHFTFMVGLLEGPPPAW